MLDRYRALVSAGELRPDEEQAKAAQRLDQLQQNLQNQAQPNVFSRLIGRTTTAPQGVYMWGGVGRGKSMLMDLFHETLTIPEKRRAHFHAFMQEVHARIRDARKSETGDPIPVVASAIGADLKCLAFDEMVVNNSADAMIMSRLFRALIVEENVAIVTTSNRPPRDLYKDGLNREHFLPFIDLIKQRLDVLPLNGPTDYRMERLAGIDSWHIPLGDPATEKVREAFFRLTDYSPEDSQNVPSRELKVGSKRTIHVPISFKGVAVFSFKRLCEQPLGAPDYLAIAQNYHTVIIVGIPQMGPDMRNEAARFVTLIDALYENRVKLFVTAETEPNDLYLSGDGSFEFERTVSRLMEMQSAQYMALGHGPEDGAEDGADT